MRRSSSEPNAGSSHSSHPPGHREAVALRILDRLQRTVVSLAPSSSIRWAVTRLFFETFGRLFRGTPHWEVYQREKAWRLRDAAAWQVMPQPVTGDEAPDLFVFRDPANGGLPAPVDGDTFDEFGRVFHVYASPAGSPGPAFEVDAIDPGGKHLRLRLWAGGAPGSGHGSERAQPARALRLAIAHALGKLRSWRLYAVVEHPWWYDLAVALPNCRVAYLTDSPSAGAPTASLRDRHEKLLRRADIVSPLGHGYARAAAALLSARDSPVSIIVVSYENWALTRACLASIETHSDHSNYEIIVIDNASGDGSADHLRSWAEGKGHVRVRLNRRNVGFSAAVNQGAREAAGESLIILNNDVVLTHGWLRTLLGHLRRDDRIGLVGPVTNQIGNEARVPTRYGRAEDMLVEARGITLSRLGECFELRTLAFFCVAMPRHVFAAAGPLDEQFGVGFFEDDDYCRRVAALGYRIVCAEDVFVHHHLSASFDTLPAGARRELLDRNRKLYEAKWGAWQPPRYRDPRGS